MRANTNLLSSSLKMLPWYWFVKEINKLVKESFLSCVLSVVHFHMLIVLMALQPTLSPGRFQDIFPFHPSIHPSQTWSANSSTPIRSLEGVFFFLTGLPCNIWIPWPAHYNLLIFMALTISGSENNFYILYARIFAYYMQRKTRKSYWSYSARKLLKDCSMIQGKKLQIVSHAEFQGHRSEGTHTEPAKCVQTEIGFLNRKSWQDVYESLLPEVWC